MKIKHFLTFLLLIISSNQAFSCDDKYIEKMSGLIKHAREETDGIASKNMPTSVILAQAILETGNGKSYSAKVRKNHFGLSTKKGLMSFESSMDSVFKYFYTLNTKPYYKKLRSKLSKGETNVERILGVFASVYAEDKGYKSKVTNVIDSCQLARFDQ